MVDMHIHTLYSDGDKTVEEVLKKCEGKKLEYISLTDHNNCRQYEDESLKKNIFTGKIVKGCEMNATLDNGKRIEFLAYNIKHPEILNEWSDKFFSKESLALEKEKQVSEFLSDLTDKDSKDGSNTNLVHVQNKTYDKLNFSNDYSSDNINEQNNNDDTEVFENLNIDQNIKKSCLKLSNKDHNKKNYSGHVKLHSEILSTSNFNINETENRLDNNKKINAYISNEKKFFFIKLLL